MKTQSASPNPRPPRRIKLHRRKQRACMAQVVSTQISRLPKRLLLAPLGILVEPDGEGFIARTVDLPLYGYGDDPIEAVENLKLEIESLYEDLIEDDRFSPEWLRVKEFLKGRVAEA